MAEDVDLRSIVGSAVDEHGFSGVVRIDRGDRTVVSIAAGEADRRHAIPNSTTTRFGVASGTKCFTALAVAALAAEGLLGLDDRVRPLLGDDLPLIDDDVTIRQLLAHRSGIGDYIDEEAPGDINDYVMPVPVHRLSSAEAYLAVLDGFPQRERPGTTFRYNNSGYVVLAIAAARATGRSYHELVHDYVIRPAGLTATGFERNDELPGDVATGYLDAVGRRSNVLHLPVIGVGDGGIVTTADDVHRLWRAFFDDRVVPSELRRAMTEAVSDPAAGGRRYGLGFWLHPTGTQVILEGMDPGVSFRSWYDPSTSWAATVISNTSDGVWPIARAIEESLGLR